MYEAFEKLPDEKKEKIIDICLKEFGENGYSSASTNTIVKKASISKGALFNYFGNKKNLFLYVLDYTTNYYVNYLVGEMKENSPDLFKRILDWTELKIKISYKNPDVYKFFINAYINIPEELKLEITERFNALYSKGLFLTFDGLDLSKFRDDVDIQKSIQIILSAINTISREKYINDPSLSKDKGLSSLNSRFEELKEYIEILKKVFYK